WCQVQRQVPDPSTRTPKAKIAKVEHRKKWQVPTCQKKKFSTKAPSPKMLPNKTGSNEEPA
ncbi:2758_t:CDS:2, partial [Gigaspora rosea]